MIVLVPFSHFDGSHIYVNPDAVAVLRAPFEQEYSSNVKTVVMTTDGSHHGVLEGLDRARKLLEGK